MSRWILLINLIVLSSIAGAGVQLDPYFTGKDIISLLTKTYDNPDDERLIIEIHNDCLKKFSQSESFEHIVNSDPKKLGQSVAKLIKRFDNYEPTNSNNASYYQDAKKITNIIKDMIFQKGESKFEKKYLKMLTPINICFAIYQSKLKELGSNETIGESYSDQSDWEKERMAKNNASILGIGQKDARFLNDTFRKDKDKRNRKQKLADIIAPHRSNKKNIDYRGKDFNTAVECLPDSDIKHTLITFGHIKPEMPPKEKREKIEFYKDILNAHIINSSIENPERLTCVFNTFIDGRNSHDN